MFCRAVTCRNPSSLTLIRRTLHNYIHSAPQFSTRELSQKQAEERAFLTNGAQRLASSVRSARWRSSMLMGAPTDRMTTRERTGGVQEEEGEVGQKAGHG